MELMFAVPQLTGGASKSLCFGGCASGEGTSGASLLDRCALETRIVDNAGSTPFVLYGNLSEAVRCACLGRCQVEEAVLLPTPPIVVLCDDCALVWDIFCDRELVQHYQKLRDSSSL